MFGSNHIIRAIVFTFGLKLFLIIFGNIIPGGWNGWNHIFDVLARNDSGWYHQIARDWYPQHPPTAGEQTAFPFFPLYPLLLSFFLKLTGDYISAALILHSILTVIWIVSIFRYFRISGMSDKFIYTFIIFYQCFPWSYFFHAFYSELLFSILIFQALTSIKLRQWKVLFLSVYLLALTRPTGLIMAAGMALLIAENSGWLKLFKDKKAILMLLSLSGAVAGVITWCVYLHFHCGDAFAFSHAQAAWGRRYKWPWEAFYTSGVWDVQLLSTVVLLMLLLSIYLFRKSGTGEKGFIALNLLFPLTTGAVTSYYRFFLVIPQIFEKTVNLLNNNWKWIAALLMAINLTLFAYWVSYSGWLSF